MYDGGLVASRRADFWGLAHHAHVGSTSSSGRGFLFLGSCCAPLVFKASPCLAAMAFVFAGFAYMAATGVCTFSIAVPQATCGSNSALVTVSSSAAVSTRAVAVVSAPIITTAVSPGSVMDAGAAAFLACRRCCRFRCSGLRNRRRRRCLRNRLRRCRRCCHCYRLRARCCSHRFRRCCRLR